MLKSKMNPKNIYGECFIVSKKWESEQEGDFELFHNAVYSGIFVRVNGLRHRNLFKINHQYILNDIH